MNMVEEPKLRNEHERSIRYFKEEIAEHGYGQVRELFEMFKKNPYLSEEYKYKLAILLSIARWEYYRETGKEPPAGKNEPYLCELCYLCGLCLFHDVPAAGSCQSNGVCILYEPNNNQPCCKEYRCYRRDSGKKLIELLRTRFHEKYYRKFKYYKNGEEIMKEEKELEDLIDKERELSHKTKLRIAIGDPARVIPRSEFLLRIRLEVLVTEREGMVAANREKELMCEAQAYGEGIFNSLRREIKALIEELDPVEKIK
jgi:hypothetical protein